MPMFVLKFIKLIVQLHNYDRKFEKQIGNYNDEQRAISTMARVVLDEHFYW